VGVWIKGWCVSEGEEGAAQAVHSRVIPKKSAILLLGLQAGIKACPDWQPLPCTEKHMHGTGCIGGACLHVKCFCCFTYACC
jgi:hypothetical protein